MVNFGFEYDVSKGFFIDLFFDYNFKKLKPGCNNAYRSLNEDGARYPSYFCDIDLGGLVVGIGLGHKF